MRVRLATFNILHGRATEGPVDVPLLRTSCAALGADVLGLQEVDVGAVRSGRHDLAGEVADACGLDAVFGRARDLPDGGDYGNALLGRSGVASSAVVTLPQWPDAETRCAVLGRAAGLSVVVCHLGLIEEEALTQLQAALDALAERPPPRVLLGDLNLSTALVEPVVTANGYVLAGGGPTFPAWEPRLRIDHVAVDGVEVVAAVVPRTASSDHCPLVVEVAG